MTVSLFTQHFNDCKIGDAPCEYNRKTTGIGFEYKTEMGVLTGISHYNNSFGNLSNLYYVGYEGKYFGVIAGTATGYKQTPTEYVYDSDNYDMGLLTARYKYIKVLYAPHYILSVGVVIPLF